MKETKRVRCKSIKVQRRWTPHSEERFTAYSFFALLRLLLVFLPQSGYVHPDEHFQATEVIAGDHFQLLHTRTWEFDATQPARSMTLPLLLLRAPWSLLTALAKWLPHMGIAFGSYTYLVYPRFIYCLLSYVNDWCVLRICRRHQLRADMPLLALASSWVMLVLGTRTFSNAIELTFCALLINCVSQQQQEAPKAAPSVKQTLLVASLCVAGVFNRVTFLCFGAPMVTAWLCAGKPNFRRLLTRSGRFLLFAWPAFCAFIIVDSSYYQRLSLGPLSLHNFVFTPWQLLRYNLQAHMTQTHGYHPHYLHLLVNMPLLYNLLCPYALWQLVQRLNCCRHKQPDQLPIAGLLNSAILVPLVCMSLINHQEPRYLMPLLVPIVLLHATQLQQSKHLLRLWYVLNLALALFFGFVHQAGVYPLGRHMSKLIADNNPSSNNNTELHLCTSHIYSLPLHWLNVPASARNFHYHEYGGRQVSELYNEMHLIAELCALKRRQHCGIYLAISASLSDELLTLTKSHAASRLHFKLVHTFYPHLSTEALPLWLVAAKAVESSDMQISAKLRQSQNARRTLQRLLAFARQFGLALYEVETALN